MATCPSCSAMIESGAADCWHCGVSLGATALGVETVGEAPTLAASEHDLERTTPPCAGASMIGREVIGQYVIRSKLGEGGMGEVYLADQPAIGRQVAIKVVHAQTRGREFDEHVERFRNEAKAAASLESPHIVQIFNWGELDDGTLFMAMEYLSGPTLAQLLREQGALEPARAVAIATQICTALSEAHGAGIVHRDLKPSNIMLVERGDAPGASFAKVLDFGIAKLEGSDITRSGAMFGTPQYMSPEQLRAEDLDGRSDLYSLGVMLFELLTGQLPFVSSTAVGYVTAHLHDPSPPLPREVPRAIAEVVTMMLAKQADERPASAAAVADALADALEGRSPASVRRRARRRALRAALLLTLGVVAVGGVGLGGWALWTERDQTAQALERELARAAVLERRVLEQQGAVDRAREEARADAQAQLLSTSKAREQRLEVQAPSKPQKPRKLDNETRVLLTRSQAQLEAELRRTLQSHRVPPSEVEEVWRAHEGRVAALAAGELEDHQLREELVELIFLYRRAFEPLRRGDELPLAQLEATFMVMATKHALDEAERQELLAAIGKVYDDQALAPRDRDYFKGLAVAKQIREFEAAAASLGDQPPPLPEALIPDEPPPSEPTAPTGEAPSPKPSGALPSADDGADEQASGAHAPLPSLDGL